MSRRATARPRLRVSISADRPTRATAALAAFLAAAAPKRAAGTVGVAIVSNARMRALNARFRGVPKSTDVLSFPDAGAPYRGPEAPRLRTKRQRPALREAAVLPSSRGAKSPLAVGVAGLRPRGTPKVIARDNPYPINHLGDIAIAIDVARRQAIERGHTLTTEIRILALHGLLHLLGYDHERDRGEMRRVEERLRRRAGLIEGLITRSRS